MNGKIVLLVLATTILVGCSDGSVTSPVVEPSIASDSVLMDRTTLPIVPPEYAAITELDARDATPPPRVDLKAPKGAPNVVIVLIDDIGFGSAGSFGGTIETPVLDRLAGDGLRFNQFHTTAICAATRISLLTGRNHHTNNMGSIGETATAFPGNTGVRPLSVAPVTEMLRANGYSTAAFGKYHETPPWEISASGPYDRWPTSSGFDKFYGFIGGEVNQWAPFLHDGVTPVEIPDDPDYHVTTDLADQSIKWMRTQKAFTPDKPFFVYFAPGAVHAPHHAPQSWIDQYKGKFDEGWDVYREETLARQIKLGVVPAQKNFAKKPH
jgi:arylsulfatase A-like enzyme